MFCLLLFALAAGLLLFLSSMLGRLDMPRAGLDSYRAPEASFVFDDQGRVIGEFHDEFRINVSLADLPEILPMAFVAAEDARFFDHPGIDIFAAIRALIRDISSGAKIQGGSTITMQVARMLLLSPEKTYSRKFRECLLAWRIDRSLSKKRILEIYLNQIYLGDGAYGVEAAARNYFNKSARELNLGEIALLAGLPKAPSRYSPRRNFAAARARQRYVLNRMAAEGIIDGATARSVYSSPPQIAIRRSYYSADPAHGYFVAEVEEELRHRFGDDLLRRGGLRVHTSLNSALSRRASVSLARGVAEWRRRHPQREKAPEAALVAIDNKSGLVVALAGGLDFESSPFNRATMAMRQPGSAFKPVIYAAAFERGLSPSERIDDSPLSLPGRRPGEVWSPRNFDGRYHGPTTLTDGLIHSRNVVTVKLMRKITLEPVISLAEKLGLKMPDEADLSLALGSAEVSLLSLTRAYCAFADKGALPRISLISRIEDSGGSEIARFVPGGRRVLSPGVADMVAEILGRVIREGTGRRARGVSSRAAGKTGTSNGFKDAWFIGFTPGYTCGVWLGFDDGAGLGEAESGGCLAAPIWRDFMAGTEREGRFNQE